MNIYTFLSWEYDLLDTIWFGENGINPRDVIESIIPNKNCRILDMCCGTLCNGIPIAKANPKCKVYGIDRSRDMLREFSRRKWFRTWAVSCRKIHGKNGWRYELLQ